MSILQDIRYTVRSLRANAAFATAAILCTALGVGATATIFSAVYATLIRPLPFQRARRARRGLRGHTGEEPHRGQHLVSRLHELAGREQELHRARHLDLEFAVFTGTGVGGADVSMARR